MTRAVGSADEGLDVFVTSKDVDGRTLAELAQTPWARGVFLRR